MIPYQNRGRREGDQILWFLFNHRIEFGISEFRDLVRRIRTGGLFHYLDRERPALRDRLIGILHDSLPEAVFADSTEEEFFLEQCLLGLNDRIPGSPD